MTDTHYCREASSGVGEPLHGTANDAVTTWVLVEHDGRWGAKVPAQAEGISEALRAWLAGVGEQLPGARLQLVRRPGGCGPRPRMMVVQASEAEHLIRVREVDDIEQLPGLDLHTLAEGRDPEATELEGPIFLVCTHGTRDRCCAKWGMPVYRALLEHHPDRVWQCSHLGGHRFAATLAVLPQGFVYGRVQPDEVPALVAAVDAGELYDLARVRGRAAHPQPLQAAELLLREAIGERRVDALRFDGLEPAEGGFVARFHHVDGGRRFIHARRRPELKVLGSCGDGSPKTFRPFELVEHGSL